MSMKIISVAAAALALTAGAASAQAVSQTQAGAGLFDQGGAFYRGIDSSTSSDVYSGNVDRSTTASIGTTMRTGSAQPRIRSVVEDNARIPSDTRNERGLGMFDRVSK
jgi:opacity protein-like surface antigen